MVKIFFIFLVSISSTVITHALAKRNSGGAIRASAFSTLIFLAITKIVPFQIEPSLIAAFFGASFVGMSDPQKLSYTELIFASIIFSILFIYVLPFNFGLGGALGAAAFTACSLIKLANRLNFL